VLAALAATGPFLTRMSGSGATCFALYERHDVMDKALEELRKSHPGWWFMGGKLR
jgi:4-diphosphocytidyl-2-C-methyl-D-erythritol kinase